ncbi:hypothetical protein BIV60_13715 [Bacillus sp. MUM 116]|uniref:hypothetical protein n=1 Tax=Bacillus sp. MUM 116 TaxID=1678002 RepID=UPI0008F5675D|nr:hypothetical protein [Bacillus sp. MUM 116]OIK13654.1 hypothetical protein BIV60_13715 [Bacillus sp. MUM 116]
MDLNTFIKIYQAFLLECEQKGWQIEVLVEEFGNHLASIKNNEGTEVQFFIELDVENSEKLNDKKNQGKLDYGVLRKQGAEDIFAQEVLDAFHQFWTKNVPRRISSFIVNKPS